MPRLKSAIVGVTAALTVVTAGIAIPAGAQEDAAVHIPGSALPFTSRTAATGAVPAATPLTIQVWLAPKLEAAQRIADAVSTPGSPQFHHYLSPRAYTDAYGPSEQTQSGVTSWLREQGFRAISTGPGRAYVRATAPVSVIDRALHTEIRSYPGTQRGAGGRVLHANSGPVSLPRSLAPSVLGVTGLDNAVPRPAGLRHITNGTGRRPKPAKPTQPGCSHYYGEHLATGWPSAHGTTSFPTRVCGYRAAQLRAAYGANTVNTGRGQTIALVEQGLSDNMFAGLRGYAKANKLPAPSPRRYAEVSLGRGNACGDPFDGEEQLDVEAAYAMAPGAREIVVGGDSCNSDDGGLQGLLDADVAVLGGDSAHPLASIASNSWGNPFGEHQGAQVTRIEHAYLLRAAAEGVGMYFSTGDVSGVQTPSSDPYAIAVGGTTLGMGKAGNRLFETGWSTQMSILSPDLKRWEGRNEHSAGGGGTSLQWQQPAYQRGVVPDELATPPGDRGGRVRALPDISADADPFTGVAVGDILVRGDGSRVYEESTVGGTSLSAPLIAGLVAAAQQGQPRPFGFLNPTLYRLAGAPALRDVLPQDDRTPPHYRGVWCPSEGPCQNSQLNAAITQFDVQSYRMSGYTGQVTRPGYDTMTGLGTPNGQRFITALRSGR